MGQFEYLMVLVSIILGLGMATLLDGASRRPASPESIESETDLKGFYSATPIRA